MRTRAQMVVVAVAVSTVALLGAQDQTVYKPGNGVTLPEVTTRVNPNYTKEAMDARIEGTVLLDAVVLENGTPDKIQVARSLDERYGLDRQAVEALKLWRFKPGTKDGKAVAVQIAVEMNFTLK